MAWIAVDSDGREYIFAEEPTRLSPIAIGHGHWVSRADAEKRDMMRVPDGSSKGLLGKQMTWEDEPADLKEETSNNQHK